jgi:recombination protein RecA
MGLQAKIVTRMVKIAAPAADEAQCVILLINQVRANLGYGPETTTGGGFALKHVTTLKLYMKRTGTAPYEVNVAGEKHRVGQEIAIRVERNKVAPLGRVAVVSFFNQQSAKYGPVGIDSADEAATLGIRLEIIIQAGAWYTFPDGHRANGREKVTEYLRQCPEMVKEIREKAIATRAHEVVLTDALDPEATPNGKKGGKKPAFRGPEAAGE